MILIAIGANLESRRFGPPLAACEAALEALAAAKVGLVARSQWYETAPVPLSDQPWFVNGVARVETGLSPSELLELLHRIEADFGRTRGEANAPRVIDLDIIDYDGRVEEGPPILPHPRMTARAFVLLPLKDVAPDWRHPATGQGLEELIRALPPGQEARVAVESPA